MTKLRSHKGGIELGAYLEEVQAFHGHVAPGLVLGGFMVDQALEAMEPSELLDAVVETKKCLPDAVQILTKCTIGNGWLRILDWGKLALTLYDKGSLRGARVHLDLQKLDPFPRVRAWAMKEKSKGENPLDPLVEELVRAGRAVLTCRRVVLDYVPETFSTYGPPKTCVRCGEAFRYGTGETCQGCVAPFFKRESRAAGTSVTRIPY